MVLVHAIVAPKQDVKSIKLKLESLNLFDKTHGIRASEDDAHYMLVPTDIRIHVDEHHDDADAVQSIKDLGYELIAVDVDEPSYASSQDPLLRALQSALAVLPQTFFGACPSTPSTLLNDLKLSYQIYPPMLLLNSSMTTHAGFAYLLASLPTQPELAKAFFTALASSIGVTHIALNAPIPALTSPTNSNILRSPTNLTPLHGSFGSAPIPSPTATDYAAALWVRTTQNGIYQTWAPLHTMFSRGNIREKTRLLTLPSVVAAVEEGRASGKGCAAVDLFAGIGYFAFSFARAGVRTVVCWDLNPWSCEGLRRGARGNGWSCRMMGGGGAVTPSVSRETREAAADVVVDRDEEEKLPNFLVFNEDNAHAAVRVRALRGRLPPVRHVNCGMLPTAGVAAWETAIRVLDPWLGGWVHLHEIVHADEIVRKGEAIRMMVGEFVTGLREEQEKGAEHVAVEGPGVELLHIEKVKSVGPKMVHVVVDLWVAPLGRENMAGIKAADEAEKST